ncbi:MAG: hypothetical protein U1E76_03370 [Planctomycetota bacterium]
MNLNLALLLLALSSGDELSRKLSGDTMARKLEHLQLLLGLLQTALDGLRLELGLSELQLDLDLDLDAELDLNLLLEKAPWLANLELLKLNQLLLTGLDPRSTDLVLAKLKAALRPALESSPSFRL